MFQVKAIAPKWDVMFHTFPSINTEFSDTNTSEWSSRYPHHILSLSSQKLLCVTYRILQEKEETLGAWWLATSQNVNFLFTS